MNNNIKKRFARRLDTEKTFKPNILSADMLSVKVTLDELEAMRLCDDEMLSQVAASEQMNVSRGTIQRLLISIRSKLIDAIIYNKEIVINNDIENITLKGENNMQKHIKEKLTVAIPTNNKKEVSSNFGGAEYSAIYLIENKIQKFVEFIELPDHKKGVYPEIIAEKGVDIVLSKAMGRFAVDKFKALNIDVLLGASGSFESVINEYLEGTLDFDEEAIKYTRNRNADCGKGRGKGNGRGLGRGCQQGLGLGRNKRG
jgi:predicted DNA-binding protein (UPF0251 family)/predicted Fe-Mo cluster-binding NifX family protein